MNNEFDSTIDAIQNILHSDINEEAQIDGLNAVRKLRSLFRERVYRQSLMRLVSKESKVMVDKSTSVIEVDSQSSLHDESVTEECESSMKVNFLLKKCKELYTLIQDYDSPTDELLKRTSKMKSQLSRAVRPHQDCIRKMFKEGLMEDISTMFIKLVEEPRKLEIQDPKLALAHYVLRKNIIRQKEKTKDASDEKSGDFLEKGPLRKVAPYLAKNVSREYPNSSARPKCKRQSDKMIYYYDEIMDEEKIPYKILSQLYGHHSLDLADRTARLITRKNIGASSGSTTNLVRQLNLSESELDQDGSLYDWTEALQSQEQAYRKICDESLREKKFSSRLQSHTVRLKGSFFPRTDPIRRSVRRFRSGKVSSSGNIKKFRISGEAQNIYSHSTPYYVREKRLLGNKCDLTPKAKFRLEVEEELQKENQLIGQEKTEREKQDAPLKNYILRLKEARAETMERLEYDNSKEYGKGFYSGLQTSSKVTTAYNINNDIINQRISHYHERKSLQKMSSIRQTASIIKKK